MQPQHTSEHKSTRSGAAIIAVALLNIVMMTAAFLFATAPMPATAQEEPKPDATATPDDTVLFDPLPHPYSRGALAYSLADSWDRTDLTYYFRNCPSTINCNTAYQAVRAGFESWAELSTLEFTEVGSANQADIVLRWSSQGPELGYPGEILAYATLPSDGGDIYFDDAEPWSAFDGSQFDIYLTATHEIGHALGLAHSSVPTALMYPVLTGNTTGLSRDDQEAIVALYGGPQERPDQNFPQQPDSSETAETVEVASVITDDYPYEIWEFDAFEGETLTITMTTTDGDLAPYVGLLDENDEVIAESTPNPQSGSASFTYTFNEDGVYSVVATRVGVEEGDTTGEYILRIEPSDSITPPSDTSTGSNTQSGILLVDIRSYTPEALCEVYVSPSTEEEWGTNVLSEALTNGNLVELHLDPGLYDVLAVGCEGTELEQYEIEVNADLAIEIYENEINTYLY